MRAADRVKTIIVMLIIAGLGIAMLLFPEAADGAQAEGRRSFVKAVLIWLWGIPGGVGLLVLATLGIVGAAMAGGPETANEVGESA